MPRKYRKKRPLLKPVVAIGTRMEAIHDLFIVSDVRNAVELFRRKYGVYPTVINGRNYIGHCSRTGTPILSGDDYDCLMGCGFELKKAKP